jgi:hypothetical protein
MGSESQTCRNAPGRHDMRGHWWQLVGMACWDGRHQTGRQSCLDADHASRQPPTLPSPAGFVEAVTMPLCYWHVLCVTSR